MSNKGCNPEKKPETCSGGGGFFSRLFGGGETTVPDNTGRCKDCGLDKCNCNCALREHLKECCGYGQLPKLIDSCNDINPPRKAANDGGPKAADSCGFKTPDLTCGAPQPPSQGAGSYNSGSSASPAGSKKCPPMPPTELNGCVPSWLCPPIKSGTPTYPAPPGVVIQPISVGGRNPGKGSSSAGSAGGSGKCGSCGNSTGGDSSKRAAPKVSKDCPMVRRRCGEKQQEVGEPKQGFIAKILSFFGFGKK